MDGGGGGDGLVKGAGWQRSPSEVGVRWGACESSFPCWVQQQGWGGGRGVGKHQIKKKREA